MYSTLCYVEADSIELSKSLKPNYDSEGFLCAIFRCYTVSRADRTRGIAYLCWKMYVFILWCCRDKSDALPHLGCWEKIGSLGTQILQGNEMLSKQEPITSHLQSWHRHIWWWTIVWFRQYFMFSVVIHVTDICILNGLWWFVILWVSIHLVHTPFRSTSKIASIAPRTDSMRLAAAWLYKHLLNEVHTHSLHT